MESLWQDIRFGVRMLAKTPWFTAIAVISLAFGIGANTALFSVVDAMLFKMLPVKEPERLVLLKYVAPRGYNLSNHAGYADLDPATGRTTSTSFPYRSFQRMREQASALSSVFAFGEARLTLSAEGRADLVNGQVVSGNYYTGLGVPAALGRTLTEEDDRAGASPVAVLSYRYWQHRFSGDAAVIGKQINLNKVAFTIAGVSSPGFEGTMQAGSTQDVTIPLTWEPQLYADANNSRMNGAGQWWLRLMGRLKPGATAEQAQNQLENAFRQSVLEHHAVRQSMAHMLGQSEIGALDPNSLPRLFLDPGGQGEMNSRQAYAPSLYLLLGVVAMVLLIACANTANLLLARATGRRKEIGVRLAIGASRFRLIRQLLTESLMLSFLGGALGLTFALWIKNGLLAVSDWGGKGMTALEPTLDWRVLGFTMALSLATGVLFGLAPAWRATNVDLTPALKDGGRGSSAASRLLLGRGLVVFQVALSLLLMIGAGLFVRTLINLQHVDLGFNPNQLLLFDAQPGIVGYKDEKLERIFQQMAERLDATPGVQKATFSGVTILARVRSNRSVYLNSALTAPPDANGRIKANGVSHINQVRENFLETMEIPLFAGRTLDPHDDANAPKVAVVNQSFAKEFFPNENPIGKRFTFDPKKAGEIEIIGLTKDAKYTKQRDETPPTAYIPWRQALRSMEGRATFEVRTSGDPTTMVATIRRTLQQLDGNLPLDDFRTQTEQANQTLAMERLFAKLTSLFGLLAQQLAMIGLFGVMAYAVAQRRHEIGVRMALGANRTDVLLMILRQGMTLALLGVALGLIGVYWLTMILESRVNLSRMLYGVRISDPLTYGVIALLLMVSALAAIYIPARRATKVDPTIALRCD
jgi:predicted permease